MRLPIALLLLASSIAEAGEPKAQMVRYPSGAEQVAGWLALPTGKRDGKRPAVIVIHEWWGLNEFAKRKAEHFADDGYVALAIDLYRGKASADPEVAHQLMRGLPEDRALRDLRAAFAYLAGRADVDGSRVGAIGWCMGGGYSLALALNEPRLAAAVIYYGRLATDGDAIGRIKAALLGNFGAEDEGIPGASVEAFASEARRRGVNADFKVYPGAGHGFASASRRELFNPGAARDADGRSDTFLKQRLAR